MSAKDTRSLAPGLALVLLAGGCTIVTDFSPERFLEQSEERCSDGTDNDNNGLTDCAEPSCRQFDFCQEASEARCLDKRDNDVNGLVDCQDPACCVYAHCSSEPSCGENTEAACTDGIDNDNNGLTDCADFACTGSFCCHRLVPIIAEGFATTSATCMPANCTLHPEDCCSDQQVTCNHFDTLDWIAWGLPRPRVFGGKFTPNQPCSVCPASGLLSVEGTQLSPDLHLEFEADLAGQPDATLSVGLVDKVVIPQSTELCGGISSPFPLMVGVTLTGSHIQTQVGGIVQHTDAVGLTKGNQKLRIAVEEDGSIVFSQDDRVLDASTIKVQPPYPHVRVLVQGHSALATVDNLLLARRSGCRDPATWTAGAFGPGPVFTPSLADARFDESSVSSPSVLFDGTTYILYYTGRSTNVAGSALGYTTSTDGQNWSFPGNLLTIHGESSKHLSDPMVVRRGAEYLMVYRSGSPSESASIVIAGSADGLTWTRLQTALAQGKAADWDGGDVSAPSLLEFRHRLYLWYVGQSKASTVPAVGLALADNDYTFVKANPNPVLKPSAVGLDDRGVAGPYVMADGKLLHMWYVGLTWGGKTRINYAASEDGRNWVRYPENPVITAGDPNLFGSSAIGGPTVLDRWGKLQMWYDGVDPGGLPSIGHAVNAPKSAP